MYMPSLWNLGIWFCFLVPHSTHADLYIGNLWGVRRLDLSLFVLPSGTMPYPWVNCAISMSFTIFLVDFYLRPLALSMYHLYEMWGLRFHQYLFCNSIKLIRAHLRALLMLDSRNQLKVCCRPATEWHCIAIPTPNDIASAFQQCMYAMFEILSHCVPERWWNLHQLPIWWAAPVIPFETDIS